MVDFQNEATVSTPAADIVRILILQRRNDVIDAIEAYHRNKFKGTPAETYEVRARLYSLFLEVQAALQRKAKENPELQEEYALLDQTIKGDADYQRDDDDANHLIQCFEYINTWLDTNKLIRIDTKKQYDTTRVSDEDAEKGL